MRVDPNAPAFPREMSWRPYQHAESSDPGQVIEPAQSGMSLRTYAVIKICAGYCANTVTPINIDMIARWSREQVDSLFAELNKEAADVTTT